MTRLQNPEIEFSIRARENSLDGNAGQYIARPAVIIKCQLSLGLNDGLPVPAERVQNRELASNDRPSQTRDLIEIASGPIASEYA
jgi:hypothetical protein